MQHFVLVIYNDKRWWYTMLYIDDIHTSCDDIQSCGLISVVGGDGLDAPPWKRTVRQILQFGTDTSSVNFVATCLAAARSHFGSNSPRECFAMNCNLRLHESTLRVMNCSKLHELPVAFCVAIQFMALANSWCVSINSWHLCQFISS